MLKIINNIMNLFGKPKNTSSANFDQLHFLCQTPLQFSKKRWPNFLFKLHNEKVDAIQFIFKDFDYVKFSAANKNITAFQQRQEWACNSEDLINWFQIEQNEVTHLRESFELYIRMSPPKSLDSFLTSVNGNIQSLEKWILTQRRDNKTALFLDEGVRTVLVDVQAGLNHLFSYLDDNSMKTIPTKLNVIRSKFNLISDEIHFTEYHFWHKKLSATFNLLDQIALGKPNYSCSEIKKILHPWFANFSHSELFVEQCVRQLLTHFIVPQIKSISDKRLILIRQFHPHWAEAITDRLMKRSSLEHNLITENSTSKNGDSTKKVFSSGFCFWRTPAKDEIQFIQNSQLTASNLESEDFSSQTVYLH